VYFKDTKQFFERPIKKKEPTTTKTELMFARHIQSNKINLDLG